MQSTKSPSKPSKFFKYPGLYVGIGKSNRNIVAMFFLRPAESSPSAVVLHSEEQTFPLGRFFSPQIDSWAPYSGSITLEDN